jgi:hypothetical protein
MHDKFDLTKERRQMKDSPEIKELEAQIALHKKRYSEVERLEGELLGNVAPQGFSQAATVGSYRIEKEALAYSIRVAEEMLAGARSQPHVDS